jgi:methionyl-tRNA synthetase
MAKKDSKNFYVTTPIYYANDKPHIGHAYTTILADVLTRYYKLMGYNTFFLTGTDEHGQKVQQAAEKRNIDPQQHVDEYHLHFKELWKNLNIEYDHFIRTTDKYHYTYVQNCLSKLYERGEIYTMDYEGWYSVSEERFFNEDELVDGKDPIGGKKVEWLSEKNYFFKMSKYQDALIDHINKNPDFIQPPHRKNEVLGFLEKELKDLCISRPKSRLSWGIPLPFDKDFVTYVWFDALLNYQSGVSEFKFPDGDNAWPASYHLLGKDILTTHAVYWPAMLFGIGSPLPNSLLVHGWWLSGESKMSKSSGNAINPLDYINKTSVDSVRYYLMRDMVLGQDATFTEELFYNRINTDLANDLGNSLNRIHKFILSNLDGIIPQPGEFSSEENNLKDLSEKTIENCLDNVKKTRMSFALEHVLNLIRAVNRYLENCAPWKITGELKNKSIDKKKADELRMKLQTILYCSGEVVRIALLLLYPVMPSKVKDGLVMLGTDDLSLGALKWGCLPIGKKIQPGEALFPRIQVKKTKPKTDPGALMDFKTAEIINVEDHPNAEKLYVLTADIGSEKRTLCAGLKNYYKPEDLMNKKIVILANLKPASLRGIKSEGMILAAEETEADKVIILDADKIPAGSALQFGNLEMKPKPKVSFNDFTKLKLIVKDCKIWYQDKYMHHKDIPVSCDACDNSFVR